MLSRRRSNRVLPARIALALPLLLATGPGCGPDHPPDDRPGSSRSATPTSSDYQLVGVVEAVDRDAGEVTIHHEDINGFMRAMTMPFRVAAPAMLDDVRPGDEVEGTLQVGSDGSRLVALDVTRPALAGPITLGMSDGSIRLAPAPTRLEPGQPVPDFAMTTQEGRTRRLSDFRGRVVVLTFIYTRCPMPEFCPLIDRKFGELAGLVGAVPSRAGRVRLLSVSFDPEHDTPDVLARHARARGAEPPLWTFAVAGHDEIRKVASRLGLTYGPGEDEIVHNLSIAVIAPDGRLVRLESGSAAGRWTPSDMLGTIQTALDAAADRPRDPPADPPSVR